MISINFNFNFNFNFNSTHYDDVVCCFLRHSCLCLSWFDHTWVFISGWTINIHFYEMNEIQKFYAKFHACKQLKTCWNLPKKTITTFEKFQIKDVNYGEKNMRSIKAKQMDWNEIWRFPVEKHCYLGLVRMQQQSFTI